MSKVTIEERLNEIISEKDERIEELENKVESLSANLDYANHAWQHHFAFKNTEFINKCHTLGWK